MYSCDFDVICITETWLNKDNVSDGLIDPQSSFRVVWCDRINSRGGGVCILISKRLDTVVIPVTNYYASLEMLCVDIYDGDSRIRLFNLYRTPNYNVQSIDYMKQLIDCLCKFTNIRDTCYIVGDFNCPGVYWQSLTAPKDSIQNALLEFVIHNGYIQAVRDATRKDNILDIVLTNEPLTLCDVRVASPVGGSDHCQINFAVALAPATAAQHSTEGNDCKQQQQLS